MTPSAAASAFDGEEAERRRAVDEGEVVLVADLLERPAELQLPGEGGDELDLGAGEIDRRRGHEEVLHARRLDAVLDGRVVHDDVVDRHLEVAGVDAEAGGRVALRVEVHHEHPVVELGEGGAEVHGGRGLAHPALLVRDREDGRQLQRRERLDRARRLVAAGVVAAGQRVRVPAGAPVVAAHRRSGPAPAAPSGHRRAEPRRPRPAAGRWWCSPRWAPRPAGCSGPARGPTQLVALRRVPAGSAAFPRRSSCCRSSTDRHRWACSRRSRRRLPRPDRPLRVVGSRHGLGRRGADAPAHGPACGFGHPAGLLRRVWFVRAPRGEEPAVLAPRLLVLGAHAATPLVRLLPRQRAPSSAARTGMFHVEHRARASRRPRSGNAPHVERERADPTAARPPALRPARRFRGFPADPSEQWSRVRPPARCSTWNIATLPEGPLRRDARPPRDADRASGRP